MSRPVGVTASAIVAILGSIVALLFAAAMVSSLFLSTAPAQPANTAPAIIGSATMFVALAGIGIWTAVGLFRLRRWARTSILIFAGFLAACCIFGIIMTAALPLPPEISGGTRQIFRELMAVMFGVPLIISAWWLIQFNTQSTKAAFSSAVVDGGSVSSRPLSITVIAVSMLITGAWSLFAIVMRAQMFVLGATFNGWTAGIGYAILGAVSLYIAKGLLDLRERARLLAIAWFGIWLVHSCLVTLVPSLRHRLDLQAALPQGQQVSMPFDAAVLINMSLVVAAIVSIAAIWFLRQDHAAFTRAENARSFPGLHA